MNTDPSILEETNLKMHSYHQTPMVHISQRGGEKVDDNHQGDIENTMEKP
jgi:hypothetical protein